MLRLLWNHLLDRLFPVVQQCAHCDHLNEVERGVTHARCWRCSKVFLTLEAIIHFDDELVD